VVMDEVSPDNVAVPGLPLCVPIVAVADGVLTEPDTDRVMLCDADADAVPRVYESDGVGHVRVAVTVSTNESVSVKPKVAVSLGAVRDSDCDVDPVSRSVAEALGVSLLFDSLTVKVSGRVSVPVEDSDSLRVSVIARLGVSDSGCVAVDDAVASSDADVVSEPPVGVALSDFDVEIVNVAEMEGVREPEFAEGERVTVDVPVPDGVRGDGETVAAEGVAVVERVVDVDGVPRVHDAVALAENVLVPEKVALGVCESDSVSDVVRVKPDPEGVT